MAEQNPGVWGIDVGQSALKAIRLEVIEGQVTATAFDYVEHPKILSQPDADPDALTREALEKFLSRNDLHGDTVAVSVPGQSGLARFVKLPPVEEKKIPDIVRFEAKQQIPFPLDEVVWDYQKIGSGTVTEGFAMETEIGLFAIKRDMVSRALQQFKEVDIEVHVVQMAPLALCNFMAFDLLKKGGAGDEEAKPKTSQRQCVVALDIGADNSNLVVTDGERIIWQRPIPFGGNHFTRALTKDMKLTFAKAEHLKRNATKSPDLKKILTSLKPVLNDFVGEVQRSLGYFTNTHRNATIAYMMGLGNAFRLPGLQKFLGEKLQLDVRKLSKMERLAGDSVVGAPAFSQNVMSFATAYGLALQGLGDGRLKTNLLPQEIQFERMIRAKKPWAVAAASALLIGILAGTASYAWQYRAVDTTGPVGKAIEQSKPIVDSVGRDESAVSAKLGEVTAREKAIRNIVAGQEDRLNWLLLNEYVSQSLPTPGMRLDGKLKSATGDDYVVTDRAQKDHAFKQSDTLLVSGGQPVQVASVKPGADVTVIYNSPLSPDAKKYWTPQARMAYFNVIERQATGKGGDAKATDENLKHLIQVNIESVVPMYSLDLKSYYTLVKQEVEKRGSDLLQRMFTKEEIDTPPADGSKGWVVEVRGYTYHEKSFLFLLDTIQKNLATRAAKAKPKEGEQAAAQATTAPAEPAEGDKPAAPLTPEQEKARQKQQLWDRIIADKIKYVALYDYKPVAITDQNATKFELIDKSQVSKFVTASAGGAAPADAMKSGSGGEMGGKLPAMGGGDSGGSSSSGWVPLVSLDSGVTGGAGSSGPGAILAPPGGGGKDMGAGMDRPPTPVTTATGKPTNRRYEFVILFVWNEPTTEGGDGAAAKAP
jgi:type IV pilus assembly protein PilM